jgi:hypothetical protein
MALHVTAPALIARFGFRQNRLWSFLIMLSALSFFLVIIVPLLSNDEPKVSLIQTP